MRGEFTEGKALTDEEIQRAGISREGTLGSIGYRIGRNAGETVISNMRNGTIDERQALWIADFAPGSDKVQSAGVRLAIEGASKGEILARMEAEQALLNMQDEMGLSGGTDLFGGALDNDEFNNFAAKYVNRKRNSLGQDISYLNKLVGKKLSKEQAKKYGINIKDPEGLRKALDKLRLQQQEWQNPWVRRELMDEIRDAWKKENPIISGSGELTDSKDSKDSKGGTDGSDSKSGSDGTGGASMSVTAVKRGGKEPPVFKMLDLYHKRDLRGESFTVKEAQEKKLFDKHGVMQAANGILIDGASFSFTAMHASPHWIQDKFRLDKIGTGEGAQMFGSGMYFTESPGVNDKYLRQFRRAEPGQWLVNGKEESEYLLSSVIPGFAYGMEWEVKNKGLLGAARERVSFYREQVEERKSSLDHYTNRAKDMEEWREVERVIAKRYKTERVRKRKLAERVKEVEDKRHEYAILLENAREDLGKAEKLLAWAEAGNTLEWKKIEELAYNYRVEIDAEEDELFYWDVAMSDKSNAGAFERIRNSPVVEVRELAEAIGANTGKKFYWALADKMREKHGLGHSREDDAQAARYASEALLASGIKGHKYADGFTREKPRSEWDYNSVMYDMDAIRITHVARGNRDWKPYVPREEEPGGASMSVVIPPRRICRTRQEALATVGGRGGSLILENRFLNLKAVFNSKSKGKFAHKDSLGRTFEALQPSGMSDEDIKTAHFSAYGNIVELFANAERMKYERAYKDKEVRKGFLHVYSPFELEGMGEKFEANIELMIFKEKGKTPMAYLLNVSLAPAAGQKGRGAGFPNLPIYLSGEIKSDFPDIVKREEEKNYGGSFSVIGPRAKTFSKYVDKAFLGRDDGKMRAEIDASQAKLKGAWKRFSKDDLLKLLDEIATPEEKKKLAELRKVRKDWVEAFSRDPEKFKKFPALDKRAKELQKELEADGGIADRVLDEMGYDFKSDPFAVGTIENDKAIRDARGIVLSDYAYELTKYAKYRYNKERTLGDILDYPELFDAYPELKGMDVYAEQMTGWGGAYQKGIGWNDIHINENLLGDADKLRSVLLHEVQHAIQDIEGFARGGTPEQAEEKQRQIAKARGDLDDLMRKRDRFEALPEEMKDMPLVYSNLGKAEKAYEESKRIREALEAEIDKKDDAGEKVSAEEIERLIEATDRTDACYSVVTYCRYGSGGTKTARDLLTGLNDSINQLEDRLRDVNPGNNLSGYEVYLRTPGEIESRNVQERRDWTAEQRQATPFNDTLEYPGEAVNFGSFSVIGPRAKTFSKYVDKAFLGRDDGKMRAEIDASQARLKGAWTAPEDLDRLATPGEKKKLDELRHAWDEWQKLAHARKPEELAEKQALQEQAAKLEKELRGLGYRMLKELGYDFKNAALPGWMNRGGRFALLGDLDGLRNDTQLSVYKKYERKLGEVLDYPELFAAYPELAEMEARDRDLGKGYYGSYDQWTHIITMNEALTPEERRSTLLHEIQHAIQDIEGFAAGSSVGAAGDKAQRIQWEREKLKDYRWDLKQTEAYPEEMKDMDRSALEGARDKLLADYTALGAEHLRKTKKERRSLTDEERKEEAELWDSYTDYASLLSMVESKGKKNAREVIEELKGKIKQTQAQLREAHGVRQSLSDYELYRRTPGEIESRNVEKRRNWTAEQRQ